VRLYCPPLAGVGGLRAGAHPRRALRRGGAERERAPARVDRAPSAYIVPDTPGYAARAPPRCPAGRRASAQDLADLVAFLLTLR
jgi:hypothetical protein